MPLSTQPQRASTPPPAPATSRARDTAVSQDLDPLRFRLAERDGRHYFQNVRFEPPDATGRHHAYADRIVGFFEGQALETLTLERLAGALGDVPVYPRLRRLLAELHELFGG